MAESKTLIAGATGFIGSRLAAALKDSGEPVRCLARDPAKAEGLRAEGFEVHVGDVGEEHTLEGAGRGVEVAHYLVHAMGGGSGYAERERSGYGPSLRSRSSNSR